MRLSAYPYEEECAIYAIGYYNVHNMNNMKNSYVSHILIDVYGIHTELHILHILALNRKLKAAIIKDVTIGILLTASYIHNVE